MDLTVTIKYKDLSLESNCPVERTVKYEDTEGKTVILQKDTLLQNKVWKGTELLDEFMKKCFRDQLKFHPTEDSL
ncbi:hypothetical protein [Parabacteroides johnsonii]|jgi:hypothetical protein|uniref:Uncharacterized protein n=1 Tax=Parabacteroides johnsonii TaxID=387661 RepID=A0A9Q5X8S4_9BACT|nr:hypothetical protein [Parabacteroides johnsonii]OUO06306.1 hypothetical protein B5F96_04490 [Parabacteroides johnsonii]